MQRETCNGTRVPRLNRFFVARWIKIQISQAADNGIDTRDERDFDQASIPISNSDFIFVDPSRFCNIQAQVDAQLSRERTRYFPLQ